MSGRRTTGSYDPRPPPAGSPYGFQGEEPQLPPQQAQHRPSAAEAQELQWMEEQRQADEYARQQQQYGSQHGQDPYATYPHKAPTLAQPSPGGESVTVRLSGEEEYFDPYAPSAAKAHRRTSSGTGGEFMYPPVYRVQPTTAHHNLTGVSLMLPSKLMQRVLSVQARQLCSKEPQHRPGSLPRRCVLCASVLQLTAFMPSAITAIVCAAGIAVVPLRLPRLVICRVNLIRYPLQDSNMVRLMPEGADGRELPPLQPGAEPPPAHLPAYVYASRNMQSSYAPPMETVLFFCSPSPS